LIRIPEAKNSGMYNRNTGSHVPSPMPRTR
jgi:hypothetical protein